MTPKQTLVAHLEQYHSHAKASGKFHSRKWRPSWTLSELQRLHRGQHHSYGSSTHFHAGENLGPGNRPLGWTTGEDVVER